MRSLLRLVFDHPTALFVSCVILAIGSAVVAFVLAERRARRIAELAEDSAAKSNQLVRLVMLGIAVALVVGAAWWAIYLRVRTEPQRVLIAVAIDAGDGGPATGWWDAPTGTRAVAARLATEFEQLGLEPMPVDSETAEPLAGVVDEQAIVAHARAHEARWVVSVVIRVAKSIPLPGADYSDYVMTSDATLIDTETGERWPATEVPLRTFLWGESPSAALELNGDYIAERLTMPLAATFAKREPLARYRELGADATVDEKIVVRKLEPLFLRSENLATGLELRERERDTANQREPENRANVIRTRLGDMLGEEYLIGTAFDGRPVLLVDTKQVSVVPGQLGYVISSEGEALELDDGAGHRTLLFEHYNFYGSSSLSRDGRVVWTTVANHGSTKSLATISVPDGGFRAVLTHPTEYTTDPTPSPDGARAVFYARPERYAETSLDVVEHDGSKRRTVVETDEDFGQPSWSHDGQIIYLPLDAWERIVAIDVDTLARTHVLGQPPFDPDVTEPVESAEPEGELDPRTTSRFPALALGHDGQFMFVIEDATDGVRWVGRFDLRDRSYERLAALDAQHLVASPTAARVAVQVRGFTSADDPRPGDDEILVLGPEPRQVSSVTLDTQDDELLDWSRDGECVFGLHRSIDPGDRDRPVARVYRYEL